MKTTITGHRIEVTASLKAFTLEKLNKLERHFDKITSIHVTFDVEKLRQIVEATISIAKADLHASAESDDMYVAIDQLVDKLDRQLIKHKEKTLGHQE